jgi:aspartate 1-decarboxylase
MNGPTAHLIKVGEIVVIMGFELADAPVKPKVIFVDEKNRFQNYLES